MKELFEVVCGLLAQPGGKLCFEVIEEDVEVLGEQAIYHLGVDVLAYEFHVTADVPEFLTDLEVLTPAFVTINI